MFDRAADDVPGNRVPGGWALRRFAAWTGVGIAVGLIVALFWFRQKNYDPTPDLTPEIFAAAHEKWKSAAPLNYDIEARVTGPQAAVYRVEVRDGEPRGAWRNDQPLTSRRTFGTWSVPGMFSTISRDVEAIERAARDRRQPPLILRATFHPTLSYPERYRRIDNGSRKGSDAIAVTWDVISFSVVEPDLTNPMTNDQAPITKQIQNPNDR